MNLYRGAVTDEELAPSTYPTKSMWVTVSIVGLTSGSSGRSRLGAPCERTAPAPLSRHPLGCAVKGGAFLQRTPSDWPQQEDFTAAAEQLSRRPPDIGFRRTPARLP